MSSNTRHFRLQAPGSPILGLPPIVWHPPDCHSMGRTARIADSCHSIHCVAPLPLEFPHNGQMASRCPVPAVFSPLSPQKCSRWQERTGGVSGGSPVDFGRGQGIIASDARSLSRPAWATGASLPPTLIALPGPGHAKSSPDCSHGGASQAALGVVRIGFLGQGGVRCHGGSIALTAGSPSSHSCA
jgi:hypothetical protein